VRRQRIRRIALTAIGAVVLATVALPPGPAGAQPVQRQGLRGDYYVSAPGTFDQFTTLKATVVDPNVDFADLEPILDGLTGQNDHNTVRWTGQIQPRYTETYTFAMVGDNGFRLWVDNQLVIDHWVDDWDNPQTGTPIALQAGRRYDIKVEFFEDIGGANLHLSWSSPSQPKEIVPNSALFLPPDFSYPGPLSSTVAADGAAVALTFDKPLQPLPAGAAAHLRLTVNGTDWPIASAALDPADTATILLRLSEPVPRRAGGTVRVVYDGSGGITTADGSAVPAFNGYVVNASTHEITTPWAKDVSPANALPEYPRPQLTRERWRTLNGTWQYAAANAADPPPVGRNLPERILVPYPPESLLSGIQRHDNHMFYRRTFTVPDDWRIGSGQRLLLHFGAVDYRATVWVNGVQVATHTGGYTAFDLDVTAALRGTGPQELIVGVEDATETAPYDAPIGKQRNNPSGIWYTSSSGIWQTVWLEPVAAAHADRLDMTPDLATGTLHLTVRTSGTTTQRVVASAFDGDRRVGTVSGAPGAELRLPVPNPKLWTPDRPFLYGIRVTLEDGNRPVDSVGGYFGMRSVTVGTVNGQPHILLNGVFVFNLGTLDQGFWPDGLYTAPTDQALKFDLQQQKALGFNTVRKHIKVEPDRWYYWADRLGLLVWQDMPATDPGRTPDAADRAAFEDQLHTMVDQHRGHPSIIVWVPFNEGWGEYDPARIADAVKAWDPSRLVNVDSGQNCCVSLPDPHRGDIYDDHTYVGPGHPLPGDGRAVVDGEFGGLGLRVPGHMWFGGGFAYEMTGSAQQLTDRYVRLTTEVKRCEVECGLSGSIYTQPYDVEGEINGLLTYDRRVVKVDADRVRAANAAVLAAATDVGNPPPPPPGTPGPTGIGYWPLDTVNGSTTPDLSGHGHDGTLINGPTPDAGHTGNALRFTGNQYVDTGASILDTTGNYSVSAWVEIDQPGNGFQTAVSQDGDTGHSEFFLQYSGQDHVFAFSFAGGRALDTRAPQAGTWYHLVGVRDVQHNQLRLYVNGQLAGSVPYCPGNSAPGHTVIGRAQYNNGLVDFWNGAIDQVHVYDRALSADEIATLYASNQ
jgi:Concanavalin A-like lectin/glucanases superfamily/PA14 domain/Glycosyl hydrolases family 2, sugar binding domain/Glycosyl hydrolases family 2/Glycosyl hydrolases family 2, TIM barrel domain